MENMFWKKQRYQQQLQTMENMSEKTTTLPTTTANHGYYVLEKQQLYKHQLQTMEKRVWKQRRKQQQQTMKNMFWAKQQLYTHQLQTMENMLWKEKPTTTANNGYDVLEKHQRYYNNS